MDAPQYTTGKSHLAGTFSKRNKLEAGEMVLQCEGYPFYPPILAKDKIGIGTMQGAETKRTRAVHSE